MPTEEQATAVMNALAEYFDCDADAISGFLVGVEYMGKDDKLHFSAMWPSDAALWQLKGYLSELEEIVNTQRQRNAIESLMHAAEAEKPDGEIPATN